MVARSSAYAAKLIVSLEVPNVYPFFLLCSHLNNGSKKIRNRYGLSISICIVPLCMGISSMFPKCSLVIMVLDWE